MNRGLDGHHLANSEYKLTPSQRCSSTSMTRKTKISDRFIAYYHDGAETIYSVRRLRAQG